MLGISYGKFTVMLCAMNNPMSCSTMVWASSPCLLSFFSLRFALPPGMEPSLCESLVPLALHYFA